VTFCDLILGAHGGRRQQRREKGVDIALAVDMLEHAFRDNYDTAMLCTGDSDFVPVLRAVKSAGKHAMCCSHRCQLSKDEDLLDAADMFVCLDDLDLTKSDEEAEDERQEEQ